MKRRTVWPSLSASSSEPSLLERQRATFCRSGEPAQSGPMGAGAKCRAALSGVAILQVTPLRRSISRIAAGRDVSLAAGAMEAVVMGSSRASMTVAPVKASDAGVRAPCMCAMTSAAAIPAPRAVAAKFMEGPFLRQDPL
ncbi:hypothetical protein SI859A1_00644 [Aurantimonas manganoxydans SI85-9A1]|uniref:Uncharacterized protein n=1 Tax=Aurantimonas manganoxydans (strain ATCC BAA-1229 / DSM 21871 / SI85-9A1) TaxID=287752 RepID=Q1YKJ9_AURMS|nr:hypothetical protein SI859A1_00644 [Aurantimonas manganoxydans SI85-9A1]